MNSRHRNSSVPIIALSALLTLSGIIACGLALALVHVTRQRDVALASALELGALGEEFVSQRDSERATVKVLSAELVRAEAHIKSVEADRDRVIVLHNTLLSQHNTLVDDFNTLRDRVLAAQGR